MYSSRTSALIKNKKKTPETCMLRFGALVLRAFLTHKKLQSLIELQALMNTIAF